MKQKEIKNYLKGSYKTQDVPKGTIYWEKQLLQKAISRMSSLMVISGLPVTVPRDDIEKALIIKGHCVFIEHQGRVWAPFGYTPYGGLSSNVYQTSLQFVGANPIVGSKKGYDMLDGVIAYNTDMDKVQSTGSLLFETITRYANLLAHCESTMANILIVKRTGRMGIAATDQLAKSIDDYLDKIEIGETKTVLANSAMVDNFQSPQFDDKNVMMDFSTYRDYLMNCFYNEVGLQTLEEKRERRVVDELDIDNGVLNNNVICLVKNRLLMCEKLNEFFGLNLEVTLFA